MSHRVYYFCTKHFKGSGMTYYNELKCIRLLGNDARIPELENKYFSIGNIHKLEYPSTDTKLHSIEWEKEQVANKEGILCYDRCPNRVVIQDIDKNNELK